ncbi:outer membrane beta-barrel protein [Nubsella zeaxanthinifaciens]|uniref:outer membrane beta-barrel protein n=1 Tax=Nubsella zeaxanthinifaciens TaxID=392412 RepID=UPI0013003438|nr:outer membrane beta-barrel protein [Nubsella zeaxanthinifaciens]
MKKLLLLIISAISLPTYSKAQQKVDTTKTTTLQQVLVNATPPPITIKTDKIILNVDKNTNAVGLNALELLRQAPGVTVDGQDQVKMSGKTGIQVLVDGRLQSLTSQQIVSLLKGTNAANIKSIEIIANPSAKYDAAGNAGIINIVLKKSEQNGLSGSLTAGYQQMKNYRQNSAFNLNFKQNKVLLFANANFDNSLQNTQVNSSRITSDNTFDQQGIEKQGYSNPGMRTGIQYKIDESHQVGALFNYQQVWDDFPSAASTNIYHINQLADQLTTVTQANLTENRWAYNLNYQYTSKRKTTFSIDADQLNYNADLTNAVSNVFLYNTTTENFEASTKTQISLSSIKADATFSLQNINVESGLKYSASTTKTSLGALQTNNQGYALAQRNQFNFREDNYAAYINLSKNIGKWNVQAGLRTELTALQRKTLLAPTTNNLPDTNYVNFFPNLFLRRQLNQKISIGFAYNTRITRPSFQDQNPYQYRTDYYFSNQGNPLLLPQISQSLTADITLNGQTQIKLGYSSTSNLIEIISTQQNDQTLTLPVNAGTRSMLNLSISSPAQIARFWNIYYSAEPYYQFYNADLSSYNGLAKINNGGFGFNAYLSNTLVISNTLKGSISWWFNYASRSSIYSTKPISSIDLSMKKQLLADKLSLTFAYRDILNTQRWQQSIFLGNVNQTSLRKWESSGAYLALSYAFGNGKIKSASQKDKSDEQLRIKARN